MSGTPIERDGSHDPQTAPATPFHCLRHQLDSLGFNDAVRFALRDYCRMQAGEE